MTTVIIDYGMGNICSLMGALRHIGEKNIIHSNRKEDIYNATKLILPGVGAFNQAMNTIRKLNIDSFLSEAVLVKKIPILGICLGMQLLGLSSTENEDTLGLGFIHGTIDKFKDSTIKIPHVGFNTVQINHNSKLFLDLPNNCDFYFTHSFKMSSKENINASFCNYKTPFIASYEVQNIVGVQFHPELSQRNGLKLLKNFIEHF